MRVSDSSNATNNLEKQRLDPETTKQLENFANKPLLLQKLLLAEQQPISLLLAKADLTAKLELLLPMNLMKYIGWLSQNTSNIQLKIVNNQVQLEFMLNKGSDGTTPQPIKLLFNQAQLTQAALKLNQPIINMVALQKSHPQMFTTNTVEPALPASYQISSVGKTATINPPTTEISLQKAIELLIGKLPSESVPNGKSLQQLFNIQEKLLHSMNSGLPRNLQLNNKSIVELISQTVSALAKVQTQPDQLTDSLAKLLSSTAQLRSSLNLSTDQASSLRTKIFNSGLFNEAHLKKTNNSESPVNTSRSPGDSKNISNADMQNKRVVSSDVKLQSLQIKQLLEIISNLLNSNNAQPIRLQQLLNLFSQVPSVQQWLQQIAPPSSNPLLTATPPMPVSLQSQELTQLLSPEKLLQFSQLVANNKNQLTTILINQRQLVSEMLVEIKQVLNKIENNQLLSLKNESVQLQQFLIDLPIQNRGEIQSFEMLLESEKQSKNNKPNKVWTVTIKFDLAPLGPMYARIKLRNQRISTHFFAQESETAALLADNLQYLTDSLIVAGLDIDQVKGQQGNVPETLLKEQQNKVDVRV